MGEAVPLGQAIYRGCVVMIFSTARAPQVGLRAKIVKAGSIRCIIRRTDADLPFATSLAYLKAAAFDFIDRALVESRGDVRGIPAFPRVEEPTSIVTLSVCEVAPFRGLR